MADPGFAVFNPSDSISGISVKYNVWSNVAHFSFHNRSHSCGDNPCGDFKNPPADPPRGLEHGGLTPSPHGGRGVVSAASRFGDDVACGLVVRSLIEKTVGIQAPASL